MQFQALPTNQVRAYQSGAPDAYGCTPERKTSDGAGNPCRHCLQDIPEGAEMLVLAHRPFTGLHPYAETGPIFLCAQPCAPGGGTTQPQILHSSPDYLLKGYDLDDRIIYGTGAVIAADAIQSYAATLFERAEVAYIHVRSARNNCYQLRINRDG